MIGLREWRILEDVEGSNRGPFKVLFWHLYGGNEENHKKFSQETRSPGRGMNPGPPQYESFNHSATIFGPSARAWVFKRNTKLLSNLHCVYVYV
jgi:hypothetical protein